MILLAMTNDTLELFVFFLACRKVVDLLRFLAGRD